MKFFQLLLTSLAVMLAGVVSAPDVQAKAAAARHFDIVTKKASETIRKITNKQIIARRKDVFQNAAARKYTSGARSIYGRVNKLRAQDSRKLDYGLKKHTTTGPVNGSIKQLKAHVKTIEHYKAVVDGAAKKMQTDKKAWWRRNGKYFKGQKLSRAKMKSLGYGVQLYGTLPFQAVMINPSAGVTGYSGGITPEIAYMKGVSHALSGMIGAYRQSLNALYAARDRIDRANRKKAAAKKNKALKKKLKPRLSEPVYQGDKM